MMKQMKFPKFLCLQDRVPSSSSIHSLTSGNSSSSSSSPYSVLPQNPKVNKKRPLLPQPRVDQKEAKKKKIKVVESSSSISSITTPPLSPKSLQGALMRIRFADLIFKVRKDNLERSTSDPEKVQKKLAKLKRSQLEEKKRVEAQQREAQRLADLQSKRVEAQLREAQRLADLESKKRQEEKQRLEQERREQQRRRERRVCEKMEAAADSEKRYWRALKELGVLTRCDHGQFKPPLEKLGFFIKEDSSRTDQRVELEEGEINEELEEGVMY